MYVAVSVAITTGRRVRDWSITKLMIGFTSEENEGWDLCDDETMLLTVVTEVVAVLWVPFSLEVVEAVIRFLW